MVRLIRRLNPFKSKKDSIKDKIYVKNECDESTAQSTSIEVVHHKQKHHIKNEKREVKELRRNQRRRGTVVCTVPPTMNHVIAKRKGEATDNDEIRSQDSFDKDIRVLSPGKHDSMIRHPDNDAVGFLNSGCCYMSEQFDNDDVRIQHTDNDEVRIQDTDNDDVRIEDTDNDKVSIQDTSKDKVSIEHTDNDEVRNENRKSEATDNDEIRSQDSFDKDIRVLRPGKHDSMLVHPHNDFRIDHDAYGCIDSGWCYMDEQFDEQFEDDEVYKMSKHFDNYGVDRGIHFYNDKVSTEHPDNDEVSNKHTDNDEVSNKHTDNDKVSNKHTSKDEVSNEHFYNDEVSNTHTDNDEVSNTHTDNDEDSVATFDSKEDRAVSFDIKEVVIEHTDNEGNSLINDFDNIDSDSEEEPTNTSDPNLSSEIETLIIHTNTGNEEIPQIGKIKVQCVENEIVDKNDQVGYESDEHMDKYTIPGENDETI